MEKIFDYQLLYFTKRLYVFTIKKKYVLAYYTDKDY